MHHMVRALAVAVLVSGCAPALADRQAATTDTLARDREDCHREATAAPNALLASGNINPWVAGPRHRPPVRPTTLPAIEGSIDRAEERDRFATCMAARGYPEAIR